MAFDLFLGNLLFGITLFTMALAVSHNFSEMILNHSILPSRYKYLIRLFSILFFTALSLLLFISQNPKRQEGLSVVDQILDFALANHRWELIASAESNDLINGGEEASNSITVAIRKRLEPWLQHDLMNSVRQGSNYFILGESGETATCRSWIQHFDETGLKRSKSVSESRFAVVCLSEPLPVAEIEMLHLLATKNLQIFFVGAVHPDNIKVLSQYLDLELHQPQLPAGQITANLQILPSPFFPMGAILYLGNNADGLTSSDYSLPMLAGRGDNSWRRSWSLMATGKMLWTSLPARLYDRNQLMYEQGWGDFRDMVTTLLLGLPWATPTLTQMTSKPEVIPVISVDDAYFLKNEAMFDALERGGLNPLIAIAQGDLNFYNPDSIHQIYSLKNYKTRIKDEHPKITFDHFSNENGDGNQMTVMIPPSGETTKNIGRLITEDRYTILAPAEDRRRQFAIFDLFHTQDLLDHLEDAKPLLVQKNLFIPVIAPDRDSTIAQLCYTSALAKIPCFVHIEQSQLQSRPTILDQQTSATSGASADQKSDNIADYVRRFHSLFSGKKLVQFSAVGKTMRIMVLPASEEKTFLSVVSLKPLRLKEHSALWQGSEEISKGLSTLLFAFASNDADGGHVVELDW